MRTIWADPYSLDPYTKSVEFTRDTVAQLAELSRSFEDQSHDSQTLASFLMRCLFSMFAEDVDPIPYGILSGSLHKLPGHPKHARPALKCLWVAMNTGGFPQVLMLDLKRFNGGLFKEADARPLTELQLGLLIEATEADYEQVEPAIFGILLEHGLDMRQRHELGALCTPRAFVQRRVADGIRRASAVREGFFE